MVFILVMSFSPILNGGNVKKAEAQKSTWHLYQILVSSSSSGASITTKEILPTFTNEPDCIKAKTLKEKNAGVGESYDCRTDTTNMIVQGNNVVKNKALVDYLSCGFMNMKGCFLYVLYWISAFFQFLMGVAGTMLNFMIGISLSTKLFVETPFITDGWTLMRDLANIFFILILLYIAIRTILGIGESENKKMIGTLIIVALLINFSMFFTKIIIDVSNELGLIFYNSIQVNSDSYIPISTGAKSGVAEKDITSSLANGFDIQKTIGADFYEKAKEKVSATAAGSMGNIAANTAIGAGIGSLIPIIGTGIGAGIGAGMGILGVFIPSKEVPVGILLAIILISGALAAVAAYCFFVVAFAFLSRLIMLWILIIFAPFAFLTSIIPAASKIEGFGWSKWSHDLISHAFMAPIFLFFLWFIMKLVATNPIGKLADRVNFADQGFVEAIILITIPMLLIIILLLKATSYAKKSSGELGGAIIKGASFLGGAVLGGAAGLALGAASGGTSLLLRKGIGIGKYRIGGLSDMGAKWASDDTLRKKAEMGDKGAQRKIALGNFLAKSSYDMRNTGAAKSVGKALGGITGAAGLGSNVFNASKFEVAKKGLEKAGVLHGFSSEGGVKGAEEREKKHVLEQFESYKLSPTESAKWDTRALAWKTNKEDMLAKVQQATIDQKLESLSKTKLAAFSNAYDNGEIFEITSKNRQGKDQVIELGKDNDGNDITKVIGIKKQADGERENRFRAEEMSAVEMFHGEKGKGEYVKDMFKARDTQTNLGTQWDKAVLEGNIDHTKVKRPEEFSEKSFRELWKVDKEYANKLTESKEKTIKANAEVIEKANGDPTKTEKLKDFYRGSDLIPAFLNAYTNGTPQKFANDDSHNWAKEDDKNSHFNNNKTADVNGAKERHAGNYVAKETEAMKNDAEKGKRFNHEEFMKAFTSGGTYVSKKDKNDTNPVTTDMKGVTHTNQMTSNKAKQLAALEIYKMAAGKDEKPSPSPIQKFAAEQEMKRLGNKLEILNENVRKLATEMAADIPSIAGIEAGKIPDAELQERILVELKALLAEANREYELEKAIFSTLKEGDPSYSAAKGRFTNALNKKHRYEKQHGLFNTFVSSEHTYKDQMEKQAEIFNG